MEQKKEYAVSIVVGEQYTENNWLSVTHTLKVDSSTTLAEIEAWYRKYFKDTQTSYKITELENQKP
jgi:hypothetical protein